MSIKATFPTKSVGSKKTNWSNQRIGKPVGNSCDNAARVWCKKKIDWASSSSHTSTAVDKILVFDPKSGILELFGFLLPNKSTKLAIFYVFLDSHTKKSKRAPEKYAALPVY